MTSVDRAHGYFKRCVTDLGMSISLQGCLQCLGTPTNRLGGLKLRASSGNAQPSRKRPKKNDRSAKIDNQDSAINKARIILERKRQQEEGSASPSAVEDVSNFRLNATEIPSSEETRSNDVRLQDEQVFESRLEALQRSVAEQRQVKKENQFAPIDYDRPVAPSDSSPSNSLALKVGVGVAVVVFGVFFAIGEFLPSVRPTKEEAPVSTKPQLTETESARLQAEVQTLEAVLKDSPEDRSALQKVAGVYAQLGEYKMAIPTLEKLSKLEPNNVEVWRLLGETQSAIGEYKLSATAFSAGMDVESKVSSSQSFALLQGLTDALISDNKASEAVTQLLTAKARLEGTDKPLSPAVSADSQEGAISEQADIVDVELLLGKAYVAWDHRGDAIAVYEGLISGHPEDFRGYLAKAILLKEKGKTGEAERMFIQARYLAPADAKGVVDRFAARGT